LLTIEVVHDLTNTRPRSVQKCELITKLQIIAMGAGNFVCGFFGAIGGGSTIGLSTVNCYAANGRYRWSGVTCSICTFLIVAVASPALVQVPAAALVGLMLVVVVHTFEWSSIPILIVTFLPRTARNYLNDKVFRGRYNVHRKIRRADGIVILLVTILTILTNLGYAIIAGVLFAALMYTWDSAQALESSSVTIKRRRPKNADLVDADAEPAAEAMNGMHKLRSASAVSEKEAKKAEEEADESSWEVVKIYTLSGPLLFSNANRLPSIFNWNGDPDNVEVHLQNCRVYDYTALNQLNHIAEKYRKKDKQIHLKQIRIDTLGLFDKAKELLPNLTYERQVGVTLDEGERGQFSRPTQLNVARGGSHRQM